ncbi:MULTISPECIES: gas vesicle protein GvpJ [unclassified Frankia]
MLERVLDKGVVIVGDVVVSVLDVELLTLKLRLFIASADTAREMGLDWWTADPFFNSRARSLEEENRRLRSRLAEVEPADGRWPGRTEDHPERIADRPAQIANRAGEGVDEPTDRDPADAVERLFDGAGRPGWRRGDRP